jgi:hypothetical protein
MRIACLAAALAAAMPARAEVTRFEVVSVQRPALEGARFGAAGTYEKIVGRVTVALDPADRRNAPIADLALAPRNAAGQVETTADVTILRPTDPAKGNGALFYEVVNRGRKLAFGLFDYAAEGGSRLEKASDVGDGLLLRQGFTLVWSGWQADFAPGPGELGIDAPTLKGVTGPAREEFIFDNTRPVSTGALTWPTADEPNISVTVRAKAFDPRVTPADLRFRLVDPTHIEITKPAGYDAGALYEVRYTARDPKVLGVGFAVTRDLVSFLRNDRSAANPLADARFTRALGYGSSQSGRFLREALYLGFNEDLAGRKVFDGLLVHIAGARMTAVNARFGLPGRNARHLTDPAHQADRFPFTYEDETDPFGGARDGIMARCRATATCPRVVQADSEHEWWASRASLLVTDPKGAAMAPPPDVRLFMVTGAPHSAGVDAVMTRRAMCQMPMNPVHAGPVLRALLLDLDAWVVRGTAPPDSVVPSLAAGSLVAADARQPPSPIPGYPYTGIHTRAFAMDWGSGAFPPAAKGEYTVYVPKVDQDGMAVGGVRMPIVAAPKATYTGWNPRAEGYGPTSFCALQGGVLPFAATRAERTLAHDPRPSLEERYPTADAYAAAVRRAAEGLVRRRLMLPEDVEPQVRAARADTLARLKPPPGAQASSEP